MLPQSARPKRELDRGSPRNRHGSDGRPAKTPEGDEQDVVGLDDVVIWIRRSDPSTSSSRSALRTFARDAGAAPLMRYARCLSISCDTMKTIPFCSAFRDRCRQRSIFVEACVYIKAKLAAAAACMIVNARLLRLLQPGWNAGTLIYSRAAAPWSTPTFLSEVEPRSRWSARLRWLLAQLLARLRLARVRATRIVVRNRRPMAAQQQQRRGFRAPAVLNLRTRVLACSRPIFTAASAESHDLLACRRISRPRTWSPRP